MRIFGFEIIVRRVRPAPDTRTRLIRAVDETNAAWDQAVRHRTGLSLWIEWQPKRRLVLRQITFAPVDDDNLLEEA